MTRIPSWRSRLQTAPTLRAATRGESCRLLVVIARMDASGTVASAESNTTTVLKPRWANAAPASQAPVKSSAIMAHCVFANTRDRGGTACRGPLEYGHYLLMPISPLSKSLSPPLSALGTNLRQRWRQRLRQRQLHSRAGPALKCPNSRDGNMPSLPWFVQLWTQ